MDELDQASGLTKSLLREYIASFEEKVEILKNYSQKLSELESFDQELYQALRMSVHQLVGSSGSYGFPDLHILSKDVEVTVVCHLNNEACSETERKVLLQAIERLIERLTEIHVKAQNGESDPVEGSPEGAMVDHDLTAEVHELAICIVSARPVESGMLTETLEGRGFTVVSFPEAASAGAMLPIINPSIIIVDVDDGEGLKEAHKLKSVCESLTRTPDFVLISNRESFQLRAKAAEFGAEAFFVTPVNQHNFSSLLDVIFSASNHQQSRVLVIQKENSLSPVLQKNLDQEAVSYLIAEPHEHLLVTVSDFKPDVVLFNYGADEELLPVARVIRMHENYFNIPILFLLQEWNAEFHLRALKVGADDCIVMDDRIGDYIRTLRHRVLRFRRSNNLIILDSLTGTLNREAFMARVTEEISLAARRNETICLAMIDVDRFKQVNDAKGHIVGDFVLRHISDYLGRRLRRSDIVGRYAGDEFLVLLPDTDLDSAYLVLDIVRKNLVAQPIIVNDTDVTISISLGLVAVRPDISTQTENLINEADKRLYEAKMSGRNTLVAGVV